MQMMGKVFGAIGLLLLLAAISGTVVEKEIRPGFFASLALVCYYCFLPNKPKVTKKRKAAKARVPKPANSHNNLLDSQPMTNRQLSFLFYYSNDIFFYT